jgi:hypothetical protein
MNDTQKQNQLSVCKDLQYQANKDRRFLSKLFQFQKKTNWLKGQRFGDNVGIQTENTGTERQYHKMGAPEMLTAVGKVLGPVYNLWRGQNQSAAKISPKLQARNFWLAPHAIFHTDKN